MYIFVEGVAEGAKCHNIYLVYITNIATGSETGGGVRSNRSGGRISVVVILKRWWEKRAQGDRPTTGDKPVRRRGASRRRAPRAGPSVVRPIRLEVSEPPRIFAI